MFSKAFLQASLERMVKTFAQVLAATLIANGTGLYDTDWKGVIGTALLATLLSFLTSVGSATFSGNNDGPAAFGPENIDEAEAAEAAAGPAD